MRLASPQWLLLLPVLVLVWRIFPGLGLHRPLRAVIFGLLVLVQSDLQLSTRDAGLNLWVLLDRSDSAAAEVNSGLPEWQDILRKERSGADRIHWVEFAAHPRIHEDQQSPRFEGDTDQTRQGLALKAVLASMAPEQAHRVLVLGDGYGTDAIDTLASAFVEAEVAVDVRLFDAAVGEDFWVQSLQLPDRVAEGAPVLVQIGVQGNVRGDVQFILRRNGQAVHKGVLKVGVQGGQVQLVDRPSQPGAYRYEVELLAQGDSVPGNNRQVGWVEVEGGPRIVLVTHYLEGPLQKALEVAGFAVHVVTDPRQAQVGLLSGARALIIEDVPAHHLSRDFLTAIPFWIEEQGGALCMVGGRHAFGSGGYFESPLDPVLPVSMELRQEHRKLAVAVAIVLDRSGSMSAQVSAGGKMVTKMELANDGSARAVELLGGQDQVAVLAVDSEAHTVVPRVALSSARPQVLDSLRRINSMGGGIYVYEGLKAAWDQLEDAPVGRRHIILFSDAADSEQPGAYKSLLKKITKAGGTVSVIGLGRSSDPDGALLEDIAKRGKGRIFFTASAADLPALFAQETVAVARSVFVTDPAGVAETAGWLEIAPRALQWPAIVDAYNLSYAKEGATVAARTRDELAAPLLAFWRRGRGRVAAVTFPLAGEGSQSVRAWPGYGDFASSLVRWLAADGRPPGLALRRRVVGRTLHIDLQHDDSWNEAVGRKAPRVAVIQQGAAVREPTWQRMGPGHWSTQVELPAEGYLRGAVQVGAATLSLGPVNGSHGLEWRRDPAARAALMQLSAATGGQVRTRLGDVFRAPRPSRYRSIAGILATIALGLFVFEALLIRTGHRLPVLKMSPKAPRAPRPSPSAPQPRPDAEPKPEPGLYNPELEAAARRRQRLSKAKRRG